MEKTPVFFREVYSTRAAGVQLRKNPRNRFIRSFLDLRGKIQRDGLQRIDGDGVENHIAIAALYIERVQQILDADIMRCKCWWIVARELWWGARDGANCIAVGRGINQHDAVGVLQRFQKNKAARAAVQALDAGRQRALFQGSDNMDADSLVAHDRVAEPQDQCLYNFIYHSSPAQTSIRPQSKRWCRALQCSHDRRRDIRAQQ